MFSFSLLAAVTSFKEMHSCTFYVSHLHAWYDRLSQDSEHLYCAALTNHFQMFSWVQRKWILSKTDLLVSVT